MLSRDGLPRIHTLVQSIPLAQTRGNSIEKWHVHIKAWDSPLYRIGKNHTQRASSPTSMAYTNIILCTQNRRIICVSYHIRGGRVPRTRQFWYTWDKPCTFILRYRDPIFSTLENNPRRAQCGRIKRLGHSNSSTYMSQKSHVLYPAPKTKPPINETIKSTYFRAENTVDRILSVVGDTNMAEAN